MSHEWHWNTWKVTDLNWDAWKAWHRSTGVRVVTAQMRKESLSSMILRGLQIEIIFWMKSESEVAQLCPTLCDPMDWLVLSGCLRTPEQSWRISRTYPSVGSHPKVKFRGGKGHTLRLASSYSLQLLQGHALNSSLTFFFFLSIYKLYIIHIYTVIRLEVSRHLWHHHHNLYHKPTHHLHHLITSKSVFSPFCFAFLNLFLIGG